VVQPDPELRDQLTRALEQLGVDVLAAEEPREALALMDRHPVGALVIDAQLSTMSGFDLVRSLRQHARGASAAIIIITSVRWSPYQKAAALHQMGLLDLLVKPVDPAHVAQLVVGALTLEPVDLSAPPARPTGPQVSAPPARPTGPQVSALPIRPTGPQVLAPAPQVAWRDTLVQTGERRSPDETMVEAGGELSPVEDTRVEREEETRVERDEEPDDEGGTHVEEATVAGDADDLTDVGPPPIDPRLLADPASHSEKRQVERATRAARAGPAELRGNLTRVPFPRLMHSLYQKRATGALFLLNDRIKKIVYFKDGHPSYIKSNRLSECLGKILMREGMITEAQCKESLRRMAETTRQQGTVLIEMGVISPHDLVVGLELQLRVKLMDIFTWTRGEYLFRREAKVPSDVITLEVSNATLIADGVRNSWDETRLDEALSPQLDRFLAPNPDAEMRFQELSLDPQEQELLDNIDGGRTLRQTLADALLPVRRAKAVAYVLVVTGVVQSSEGPVEQEPELAEGAQAAVEGEESLRERLAAELLSLRQRDAFGVLGVSRRCRDREAKEAHARAARDYHPDRFRHLAGETRRMAQEIFRRVNDAYESIATAKLRKQYREQGVTPMPEVEGSATDAALEADDARKQARQLMGKKQWPQARQLLATAVNLCPDSGDLRAMLAWTTYRSAPESASMVRTAIRELRHAIELAPRNHEAYLFLARIYAGMGKTILAEKQYEKVLQCNPDCAEALDELKIQKEKRPPRRYRF